MCIFCHLMITYQSSVVFRYWLAEWCEHYSSYNGTTILWMPNWHFLHFFRDQWHYYSNQCKKYALSLHYWHWQGMGDQRLTFVSSWCFSIVEDVLLLGEGIDRCSCFTGSQDPCLLYWENCNLPCLHKQIAILSVYWMISGCQGTSGLWDPLISSCCVKSKPSLTHPIPRSAGLHKYTWSCTVQPLYSSKCAMGCLASG